MQHSGAVAALAGTVTGINTPTRGWTSVTNPLAANVGAAAETDAELRVRQGQSVALPSLTPFDAVDGALANISGVTRHKLYENDTGSVDINGLPAHSISAIVDGGDATTIAQTIRGKKGRASQPTAPPLSLYRMPGEIHTRHRFLVRLTYRFMSPSLSTYLQAIRR
jgi:uncharacterized phage protein gp47/JayE